MLAHCAASPARQGRGAELWVNGKAIPSPVRGGRIPGATCVRARQVPHHLTSCSAFGRTAEEALAEVERAKAAWLQAARGAGKPIPPPRYRPIIYQVAG